MSETVTLATSLTAGAILGTLYFRGLWHTVVRLPDFRRPAWSMAWSFAVRVLFVLSGFYLIMGGHLERLALAMVGFLLARQILVRRIGKWTDTIG